MITWRLEVHDELPSTSTPCIAAAEAGAPAGLAVLARGQTAGRGSRGRGWVSPPGNLYLSFLLRPATPMAEAGIWPLLISLAMHDALAPLLPDPSALTLKWPNDLMLHGAKLAGLLLDVGTDPTGRLDWLVAGCGVNLAVAPDVPGRRTASLAGAGLAPPPVEEVARALLNAVATRSAERAQDGTQAIHTAWLARAHKPGTPLSVHYAGQQATGTFAGLSPEGHLLLRDAAGLRTISSGEVLLALH